MPQKTTDKAQGTDERAPAPARADEANGAAPAAGGAAAVDSKGLDWQGVLKQVAERAKEDEAGGPAPKPAERKPRAGGTLPPIEPEDGEIPLGDEQESPTRDEDLPAVGEVVGDQDQAASAEDEAAVGGAGAEGGDETPHETAEDDLGETSEEEDRVPTKEEYRMLRDRLREKEKTEAELLELKGRLGQRLGDLERQMKERLEASGTRRELTEDERTELANKELAKMAEVGPRAYIEEMFAQAAEQLKSVADEQRRLEIDAKRKEAPDVAFGKFRARYKDRIGKDPMAWANSQEGQSIRQILATKPTLRRAYEAYREDGDAEGIASVLSDAMDLHIAREKARGKIEQKVETKRTIRERKSAAIPASPRPRGPSPRVNLHDPSQWRTVLEAAK